jgi:hypothetical protein
MITVSWNHVIMITCYHIFSPKNFTHSFWCLICSTSSYTVQYNFQTWLKLDETQTGFWRLNNLFNEFCLWITVLGKFMLSTLLYFFSHQHLSFKVLEGQFSSFYDCTFWIKEYSYNKILYMRSTSCNRVQLPQDWAMPCGNFPKVDRLEVRMSKMPDLFFFLLHCKLCIGLMLNLALCDARLSNT